jgi:stage II sporulation protein GA (sporulation sigma-E factor processing peptidase)
MYLDLLFSINLAINYFILLVTAKLFRKEPGATRLLIGAAVGALAVLLFKLPPYPLLSVAVTISMPIVMALLVFWPLRWLELFIVWCSIFLVTFMTGGAVLALSLLNNPGDPFQTNRGIASLFMVCLFIYLILSLLRPYLEERKWQKIWQWNLLVSWQGKEKTVPAYLDTGNRLREPFSQRSVIIVHYRCLEGLLPPVIYQRLSDPNQEPWMALPDLEESAQACCFTLVPFSGLGARNGMLLGFKPDAVTLSRGQESWRIDSKVVLGLTRRGFGPVAEYQALLPPDLLQAV